MQLLSPDALLSAYARGIFPMSVDGEIRWFSPDPRGIIPLATFHASKTLMQTYRGGKFEIRFNTRFRDVMMGCAKREEGTWISKDIVAAYCRLHSLGLAHSVEAWREGKLAGGLYGVSLGGAFFGESMFHRERDASKAALVGLVDRMRERGFVLLDSQYVTPHLQQFGAVEIPRAEYIQLLAIALKKECVFK